MIDYTIDQEDLQALFINTRFAYGSMSFEEWTVECKEAYATFIGGRETPLTFSQWVNGQILAIT
tara:strand:- start:2 stop:193 length:192 start_codon:yes stop_codon:yes gene_type:complete